MFTIRNYNYVGPYHCNYTFIPPAGYNANITCQALKIGPSDQDETCPIHSFEIFDKKYCGSTTNDSFFERKSSANPIIIKIDASSTEASGSYDCKLTTNYDRCSCGRLKTVSVNVVIYLWTINCKFNRSSCIPNFFSKVALIEEFLVYILADDVAIIIPILSQI